MANWHTTDSPLVGWTRSLFGQPFWHTMSDFIPNVWSSTVHSMSSTTTCSSQSWMLLSLRHQPSSASIAAHLSMRSWSALFPSCSPWRRSHIRLTPIASRALKPSPSISSRPCIAPVYHEGREICIKFQSDQCRLLHAVRLTSAATVSRTTQLLSVVLQPQCLLNAHKFEQYLMHHADHGWCAKPFESIYKGFNMGHIGVRKSFILELEITYRAFGSGH